MKTVTMELSQELADGLSEILLEKLKGVSKRVPVDFDGRYQKVMNLFRFCPMRDRNAILSPLNPLPKDISWETLIGFDPYSTLDVVPSLKHVLLLVMVVPFLLLADGKGSSVWQVCTITGESTKADWRVECVGGVNATFRKYWLVKFPQSIWLYISILTNNWWHLNLAFFTLRETRTTKIELWNYWKAATCSCQIPSPTNVAVLQKTKRWKWFYSFYLVAFDAGNGKVLGPFQLLCLLQWTYFLFSPFGKIARFPASAAM